MYFKVNDNYNMLDGCRRITSKAAQSRDLIYVMIDSPNDMSDLEKITKSDGLTLKSRLNKTITNICINHVTVVPR